VTIRAPAGHTAQIVSLASSRDLRSGACGRAPLSAPRHDERACGKETDAGSRTLEMKASSPVSLRLAAVHRR